MKLSSFKVKNLGWIKPKLSSRQQIHIWNGSFTIRFFPKSKTTSCSTYSHNHTQLLIHRLFYLNLSHTNTHVCNFEIPLKVLDNQQLLILYAATYLHQFLYMDLLSSRCLLSQKVTKSHKSYKSNSQNFQELLKRNLGLSFYAQWCQTQTLNILWALGLI